MTEWPAKLIAVLSFFIKILMKNDITAILWRPISHSNFEATELILDLGALDTCINT